MIVTGPSDLAWHQRVFTPGPRLLKEQTSQHPPDEEGGHCCSAPCTGQGAGPQSGWAGGGRVAGPGPSFAPHPSSPAPGVRPASWLLSGSGPSQMCSEKERTGPTEDKGLLMCELPVHLNRAYPVYLTDLTWSDSKRTSTEGRRVHSRP